ncbi:helix-turn-helix domain-containing protein [Acidianus brierleyi]|nr:helix-turn-helix domain-containing protein [Acidianus brierleyi]
MSKVEFPDGRQVEIHKLIGFIYGLCESETNILHLLLTSGEKLSEEDIALRLNLARTSINKPINALLSKNLVKREKQCEGKVRKPKYVYYTDKVEIYNKIIQDLEDIIKKYEEAYKVHVHKV